MVSGVEDRCIYLRRSSPMRALFYSPRVRVRRRVIDRMLLNAPVNTRLYSWCSAFLILAGVPRLGEATALDEGAAAA
jgi:hypothetical protein